MKNKEHSSTQLYIIKTSDKPIYWFLTGGAGVGKTTLFKFLFNGIVDYYNSLPGYNLDETCMLMVAPTREAAVLLGGVTMHTAFCIPFGKNLNTLYQPLDPHKRNKIRSELQHIKYIFIDEILMSGCLLFNYVKNF